MNESEIEVNAMIIHASLKNYYNAWLDLEKVAKEKGLGLNEKTGETFKLY